MRKVRVRLIGIVGSLVLVATGVAVAQELSLSYLTYLDPAAFWIAVDDAGNAYVTGGDVVTKLAPNGKGPEDQVWEFTFDFDAQAASSVDSQPSKREPGKEVSCFTAKRRLRY